MVSLSTLTIDLVANSAKLVSGLKKASKGSKSWASTTRKQVNSVGKSFAIMSAAAIASTAAIVVSANKSIDSLGKLSDKLGETPAKLQALQRAGELTGVGVDTTNMALQRMTRRTAEAAQGTGEAVNALRELNIDAKALAQLSPAEQFKAIADAMGGVSEQGDKVRLAMKLFDSEGVALVNTLALGSEGLNQAEQDIKDYGIALTRVDIAKVEAANDEIFKAKETSKAFSQQLAVELAPVIAAVANEFSRASKNADGLGLSATRLVTNTIIGFSHVADVINGLKVVFLGVKAAALDAFDSTLLRLHLIDLAVTSILNVIPGINASLNSSLSQVAADAGTAAIDAKAAFDAALLAPPPSEKVKALVKRIMDDAQVAAEEIAANAEANVGGSVAGLVVPPPQADVAFGDGRVDDEGNTNPFLPQDPEGAKQQALDLFTAFREQKFSAEGVFQLAEQAQKQKHEAALSLITNKEEKRRLKAKQSAEKAKLGDTKKFFAQGFSDLAKNSKKAFELQKAFKIAETVQNTYSAAMGAYNALASIPYVGPALGAAAAAAAIAFGGAQINAIKSQSFQGGSVSSSTPTAVSTSGSSGPSSTTVSDLAQQSANDDDDPRDGAVTVIFQGDVLGLDDVEERIIDVVASASANRSLVIRDSSGTTLLERVG